MMDEYFEGICEWFGSNGQSYGYISYIDGQIYTHYKNISTKNLRDPKFREIRKGDKVKFKREEGYKNNGTQAVEVEIIELAPDND